MQNVLTLIGAPHLDTAAVAAARAAVANHALDTGEPDWLAPGVACDLPFDGPDTTTIEAAVRGRLAGRPVDLAIQPAAGRRKELLIADMDSTIIEGESLDELAALAGVGDPVAAITARAMNGEIDFRGALIERVALLDGLPADTLDRVIADIRPTPGAAALVATMRAHGAFTALVSGGFRQVTGAVRARLGFDHDEANELEIAGGRLTGRVREPILNRDGKAAALVRLCREHGLPPADAAAVGDGANDLTMLQRAGLGVAYHAKPAVRQAAPARIDHADLTALLYLQGFRAEEIVAG
ncbi:MAG: phosphoserine phosphatase SerB [Inquilinus sp.]|nr:phosphoserine phosphatase SerB [Inquilinus sp.]